MGVVITTLNLPTAKVGAAYNQTPATSGGVGPYTWSVVAGALPNWLTLNAATGQLLSAAVNSAGVYNFTLQVVDSTPSTATQSYAIGTGYSAISDIASWVTGDYLKRSDITTETQNAANQVYRITTAKVPFEQLVNLSAEIPLVVGQDTYDLSQLVPPLLGITDIRLTLGPGQRRRLRRSSGRMYDSLSIITNSRPSTYARSGAQTIQLNPPPDQATYTMRVRYWSRPPEDTVSSNGASTTVLSTPLEWDALFKWETAWWVLNELGQEQRAMQLVQPMMMPRQQSPKKQPMLEIGIIPRLWNELLTTISQKENVDEDFSVNPVIRAYTYRGR